MKLRYSLSNFKQKRKVIRKKKIGFEKWFSTFDGWIQIRIIKKIGVPYTFPAAKLDHG
jgi:hypothetical protein